VTVVVGLWNVAVASRTVQLNVSTNNTSLQLSVNIEMLLDGAGANAYCVHPKTVSPAQDQALPSITTQLRAELRADAADQLFECDVCYSAALLTTLIHQPTCNAALAYTPRATYRGHPCTLQCPMNAFTVVNGTQAPMSDICG
jgi:hypothetical protein